jgi:peroxiredoxin
MIASMLMLAVLPACQQERTSEARPTGVGEYTVAPDFTLPDLNGTEISLAQYRGKVVLLNFWATWCPPCRLEMPTIEEAYQRYKDQGFEVVAVSVDAGPQSDVQEFVHEFDLSFQVLLDPNMEVLHTFQSFSLPTTVVIDRQGVIRSRELGYRDWTDAESTKLLTRLLNERPS